MYIKDDNCGIKKHLFKILSEFTIDVMLCRKIVSYIFSNLNSPNNYWQYVLKFVATNKPFMNLDTNWHKSIVVFRFNKQ